MLVSSWCYAMDSICVAFVFVSHLDEKLFFLAFGFALLPQYFFGSKVYHIFSRVQGDIERDYNDFVIEPSFFSQGPGNFRDVAQNRRSDVMFQPRIGAFNLRVFLSFIQADGYQPDSVEAVVFTIKDKAVCDDIATRAVGHADGVRSQRESLSSFLNNGPFRPGQLFLFIKKIHAELLLKRQNFVNLVLSMAESTPMAMYKNGFWADYWTYLMDFIESYLGLYREYLELF